MENLSHVLQPQFVWLVVGFLLIISEFAIPGLVIGFFGVGALIVGVLCSFLTLSVNLQLLIFLSASVLLLLFLRKKFKKVFIGVSRPNMEDEGGLDEFVGEKAVVKQDIKPNLAGKVEFHGTDWEAEADAPIAAGTPVEIIGKKNITLIVKQIA